jgi:predicted amidohydrolase YtcJ
MNSGEPFFPEQCMTRLEALRSYTRDAAYAAFEEETKGTLTPGKLADLVVLTQDLHSISDNQIMETRVAYTIIGGKVVYDSQKSATAK